MKKITPLDMYLPQDMKKSVNPTDFLFECKENRRGSYMYRKLIGNKKHTFDGGEYCVKSTGKWFHEDDFGIKWVNPLKQRLWIVEHSGGVIYRVVSLFIPGEGWKEGGMNSVDNNGNYNTCLLTA